MNLEIIRPYILIFIPVVIGLLFYSRKFIRSKNNWKKNKYVLIRSVVFTFILLALCGIRIKWSSDLTTTIFLLDASDSVKGKQKEIESFVADAIADMPKNNQAGIITFGKDAVVEQFVTDKKIFQKIESSPVQTATNLEHAVSRAIAILPDDSSKRLVLLTDGAQNEGDIENLTSTLLAQNIDFKVVRIDQEIGEEVYVSDMSVPDKINIGDTFSINVSIMSNVVTDAKVYLYSGRQLKGQLEVNLQKGENKYVFKDTQNDGGLKNYKVVVEANHDTNSKNNEYSAFTDAQAKPRVLLVEGQKDNGDAFEKLLKSAGVAYDKVTPSGAPTTIARMNEYKSLILLDAYIDDFKPGFLKNLDSYVKDYAGGVIAIGGENSFALGGYKDTALEQVLPVEMDLQGEKEIPKMAMAMVIDHSGSMLDTGGGNVTSLDLAKQAAVKGLESLRKTDEVAVMAFDHMYDWVVPFTLADDIETISDEIATIGPGGGTSIYPALKEAVNQIKKSDAKLKHIILLTDGQDGFREYDDVLQDMLEHEITLSTVAIGEGADVGTMQYLAEEGNGRFYYTDINNSIPRIFAKEIFLSVKSYLIQEEFTPVITNTHTIIKGTADQGLPSLLGYIASTAKPTATTILESHLGDPILTVWQYGLGKTAAWNSDGTNQWTRNYAGWDNYLMLWKNIIDFTITDTSLGDDYFDVIQEGTSAKIRYSTKDYNANTIVNALVTSEDGEQKEVTLNPSSPGEFAGEIELDDMGVYSISLRNMEGDTIKKNINTAAAIQYSPEYRFDVDNQALNSFISQVNGSEITKPSQVFETSVERVKARFSLTNLFLILALLIFMADIATRRLNLHLLEDFISWCSKKLKKEHVKVKAAEETAPKKEVVLEQPTPKQKKKPKVKKEKAKKQSTESLDTSALLKKKKDREL